MDAVTSEPTRPVSSTFSAHGGANGSESPEYVVSLAASEQILTVLMAMRKGDFTARLPLAWSGVSGKIADTINAVMDQNQRMAAELERISRVVGQEGRINQRAQGEIGGAWEASLTNVNTLISDLVHPTSETARVIGAVAQGDLSQMMAVETDGRPLQGEFLRTAKTVNTMVTQLGSFASEVTRVAREVGTEGKLGGQAEVKGVAGTWKDLTDSVNSMAGNLTSQVRNIADVTKAVASGDLSKKITVDVKGEFLDLKSTINTMVDQLRSFASEVTRVAREVGTEGKLGGQARVEGVAGTWKDLTDSVNSMAGNLTSQVRNIAQVTTAVANGDLSKKITVDVKGEILELKNTVNTMVDQLSSFASEVTRVAREVGTEGKLGGQADVKGVAGTWKDLTDNVNFMAGNLTSQVRNIAQVTTAVANGDLSKKITVDVKGEILELKNTVNTMVDQLSSFASEVTRVAREVGTEGKLGGQADVKGVAGTWKDLTDNVNFMAGNLTSQVRNIADVTKAVASGDLSKKITVDVKGEILELKNTINTMVDQLNSFASEVTRVAREVGTEGKLGGQADVQGVAGTWKDLTDNVNLMAGNLTAQVRNIAEVTKAIANGDLSKKITVDVKGEILEMKDTINTLVDQLSSFASEVTRVAREVGTEGKLGGQADVKGVAGTWKDLTDSVNSMAKNLTSQVRNIAQVTTAVANGDLSKKITVDVEGEILELKDTINTMVDQLNSFASEVTRVAREVGTEGKLGGQAEVKGVGGTWKDLTDNVNFMAGNLTSQVRNIADVTKAVASGDLSKKITVDVKGEILELKNTINTMVDQLNSFASEVTRVAREVGTEGKLGGQADVKGVSGTWKDLTDNVNFMAGNLTGQVRGIAKVVTAVARGDLKQKLTVEAKGEIAELAETINGMTETLATFADQVTTVAREVGVEGKLGGQASVPGAAGTWKDLTDNVNQLAANLTTQVRAIADVATAVTKGDLTRSIQVEAKGEVAALKDNINEMIRNLKETTHTNQEQDWLKTNLAKFSRMLQGQKDRVYVGKLILSELAPVVNAQQGMLYTLEQLIDDKTAGTRNDPHLQLLASYAFDEVANVQKIDLGQGMVGQCAVERQKISITDVPSNYVRITSSLGESTPANILILPVLFEGKVKGVIELASFNRFSPAHQVFLDQLMESVGIVLNTIEANMRTEALLEQSQSLAKQLQSRQEELQKTNQELEIKAQLLADRNQEVERKNQEVEQARSAVEEKAKQLALTSKYKSEFLANMSHELRTPLNSLLILSDQLSKNLDGNLSGRQVDYAKTIHGSGNELLALINDILDLSKIESGTVTVEVSELMMADLQEYVDRTFRHMAETKGLRFSVTLDVNLPRLMNTDAKRLQQIIKNLLSNAFKFTAVGEVALHVSAASSGWSPENETLNRAMSVLAFSVRDTGIGINPDKQQIIFEAFQQADGSTSRKYGGTGLGLAISREISRMLGGEIKLVSAAGEGSTFTLYLPRTYTPPKIIRRLPQPPTEAQVSQPELKSVNPEVEAPQPVDEIELANRITDDRGQIRPGDKTVLIVDNDPAFARIVLDSAHEGGFKALVTPQGGSVVAMVEEFKPDLITLDIRLKDFDGWRVLDLLKNNLNTRHVPVYIISATDNISKGLRMGAFGIVAKPLSTREPLDQMFSRAKAYLEHPTRRVLLVAEEARRERWLETIGRDDLQVHTANGLEEAYRAALDHPLECVIVDHVLPDGSGEDVAEKFFKEPHLKNLPVIIYSDPDSPRSIAAMTKLNNVSGALLTAAGSGQLADRASLALHRKTPSMPSPMRTILETAQQVHSVLVGRKVLVVDDDIRNIFAMTSVLERQKMHILSAETGKDAINLIKTTPDIDVVLMDIMMPDMDGYDTTREIRKIERFHTLPIIAVTAKAMKGDREKCIEAGATEYLSKPVDTQQLLSMLRVIISR